jgi:hypothetical protein
MATECHVCHTEFLNADERQDDVTGAYEKHLECACGECIDPAIGSTMLVLLRANWATAKQTRCHACEQVKPLRQNVDEAYWMGSARAPWLCADCLNERNEAAIDHAAHEGRL